MPYKDKEQNAEYMRQWYEKNKEKQKEYKKQYHQNNKEQIIERVKQWSQNNKERQKEYKKQYHQNNKEQIDERHRQWRQTLKGRMLTRIYKWKNRGIKLPEDYGENWDIFYEQEYMRTTHCEECNVELTEDRHATSTTRCLDHDHDTGLFRNILCQACNVKRLW